MLAEVVRESLDERPDPRGVDLIAARPHIGIVVTGRERRDDTAALEHEEVMSRRTRRHLDTVGQLGASGRTLAQQTGEQGGSHLMSEDLDRSDGIRRQAGGVTGSRRHRAMMLATYGPVE